MSEYGIFNPKPYNSSEVGKKVLKLFEKLKRKANNVTNNHAPLTTDIGVEPVGNEEFVPITKKDYGFDWDNRKFLSGEDYMPE